MGGMIAVVVLALLMVPVCFVVMQRMLGRDQKKVVEKVDRRSRTNWRRAARRPNCVS